MWLMNYITKNSINPPKAVKGDFSSTAANGAAVAASDEHKGLELCMPYGVLSLPPEGERTVVLPLDDGEAAIGVLTGRIELEAGELKLFSKGGASIVLKNDGRVLINGREF